MTRVTQKRGILDLLRRWPVSGITNDDIHRAGYGMRGSVRIFELRADGHDISKEMVKRGDSRVALYRLTL